MSDRRDRLMLNFFEVIGKEQKDGNINTSDLAFVLGHLLASLCMTVSKTRDEAQHRIDLISLAMRNEVDADFDSAKRLAAEPLQ